MKLYMNLKKSGIDMADQKAVEAKIKELQPEISPKDLKKLGNQFTDHKTAIERLKREIGETGREISALKAKEPRPRRRKRSYSESYLDGTMSGPSDMKSSTPQTENPNMPQDNNDVVLQAAAEVLKDKPQNELQDFLASLEK
jgi:hypothetical protein